MLKNTLVRVCPDVYAGEYQVLTIEGFTNRIGSQSENRISPKPIQHFFNS